VLFGMAPEGASGLLGDELGFVELFFGGARLRG